MQKIRLHIDGARQVWVLFKCRQCGEVDKHALLSAFTSSLACRKCSAPLDMTGATIDAVDAELEKIPGPPTLSIRQALERDGLRGAVKALNASVPHRYTGIFLKDGAVLRNVALFDKQNLAADLWAPFPMGQSFCSLIIGSGDPLTIREAETDFRDDVKKHPAGQLVQSYCGIPLMDPEGTVLGTLCHFDEQPITSRIDLVEMLQMPALLGPYLPR